MNRFSQGQLDKTLDLLRQAQELFAQKKHLMTEAQREKVLQQIQEAKQKVEDWHRELQAKEKAGKQAIEDAKRALVIMGEKKAIVDQLVSKVVEGHGYLPAEELIKEALRTRISSIVAKTSLRRIFMDDYRKISDELLRTAALKKVAGWAGKVRIKTEEGGITVNLKVEEVPPDDMRFEITASDFWNAEEVGDYILDAQRIGKTVDALNKRSRDAIINAFPAQYREAFKQSNGFEALSNGVAAYLKPPSD